MKHATSSSLGASSSPGSLWVAAMFVAAR
jgi:hypothetical protein